MGRLAPTKDTLRALFARSGNICAFPGCTSPLLNDKNKFIGQICHIEAAEPGGERYNSAMSDEDRRCVENLILLCYPHHVETNDVHEYPVEILKQMKHEHESKCGRKDFKIDEAALYIIAEASKKEWRKFEEVLEQRNREHEYEVIINSQDSFFDVLNSLKGTLSGIDYLHSVWINSDEKLENDFIQLIEKLGFDVSKVKAFPYWENPFVHRNWTERSIHLHNLKSDLSFQLCHLEIKFLEEYLKTNSTDVGAKERLAFLREEFQKLVTTTGYVD